MSIPLDRVAVVMMSTVGNAVHTLPVVNSIKAHRPDARITWIMQPGSAALVQGHPAVDEVVVVARKQGMAGFAGLRRELAGRRFDVALNLQAYFKAGVATRLTGAPIRVGYDRARARDLTWMFSTHRLPARPRGHVQDEFLEFLDFLGVPVRLEWGLEPTAEEGGRYAPLLPDAPGPTVAMVVGTTKPEKEWPAERYAALADRIAAELGGRTVLVGGRSPREEAAAAAIRSAASHPPLDLREWDLRRLAYLLSRSDVLVSPDTGPLHMGVALGTPTVSLMGHTNPKRYGPYRRYQELLVDAFGDPGEDYGVSAPNRAGRMERITVEQVMEKVELALRRYRNSSPDGQPSP
ncbi:MAG TPA: glycosyltransferase family 9 protein [Longimicrobium sp.]|jgi:heptosyltransferase I|uniref:glycosyltransferase family 9 protein n=1 Tax=Longimicrobium sp. TaxID=2029185 RepID=UPI002ED83317